MQTDLRTRAARRRRRTIRCAPLIVALTSLVAAGPALASKATVDYIGGTVLFQAGTGEVNDVSISPFAGGQFEVNDLAHPAIALDEVMAPSPCTVMEPFKFRCGAAGLNSFAVHLGDGADKLAYSLAVPVKVTAGTGAKTVATGSGSDTIDVRNGASDTVSCGAGTDVVLADAADTVATDCEAVNPADPGSVLPGTGTGTDPTSDDSTQAPGNSGSAPAPDALAAALGITLPSLTLDVPKPTRMIVPLSCATTAVDGCRGEVVLTVRVARGKKTRRRGSTPRVIAARGHFTAQQRRRTRRIGRRSFKLAAGESVKLPVHIALRGHFALASRRRNRAKARLEVVQRDAAGKVLSVQTRSVTLQLHKHRWSRKRSHR